MRETEGVGLQRFTVPGLDSTQWTRSKRDYAQLVFYYQDARTCQAEDMTV